MECAGATGTHSRGRRNKHECIERNRRARQARAIAANVWAGGYLRGELSGTGAAEASEIV